MQLCIKLCVKYVFNPVCNFCKYKIHIYLLIYICTISFYKRLSTLINNLI